jgi:hypothetical protein
VQNSVRLPSRGNPRPTLNRGKIEAPCVEACPPTHGAVNAAALVIEVHRAWASARFRGSSQRMLRTKRARPATEPRCALEPVKQLLTEIRIEERDASKPMLHAQPRGRPTVLGNVRDDSTEITDPISRALLPEETASARTDARTGLSPHAAIRFSSLQRCFARDLRLVSISRSSSQLFRPDF